MSSHWYLQFIFIGFFLILCPFISENPGSQNISTFAQSFNTSKIISELLCEYHYIKQSYFNKFRICLQFSASPSTEGLLLNIHKLLGLVLFFPPFHCGYSILLKYFWVYLFLLSVFPSHIYWFNFLICRT